MSEIWKDIPGYEGLYQVSNMGRILSLNYGHRKSWNKKELKLSRSNSGYYHVQLYKNGIVSTKLIHVLVATVFVENCGNKPEVNHKDGNKKNNCASNLEWVTRKENLKHAVENGLRRRSPMIGIVGAKNKLSKSVCQISKDGVCIKIWESLYDAEKEGGYNRNSIRSCANNYKKTYKGYVWRYCSDITDAQTFPSCAEPFASADLILDHSAKDDL